MSDVRVPAAQPEELPRVTRGWLAVREPADAQARATDLVGLVRRARADAPRLVIHDLGCGTGSMGRWLAPQLPGRQHWIMYDRDAGLLDRIARDMPARSADGGSVTVETRQRDITRLTADDLHGAGLVTASALLDMLTRAEVDRIVAACVGALCPALLTLSVIGRVELTPADPLDDELTAAFNAHQRRTTGARQLLGPDAVAATVEAFAGHGTAPVVRSSPWLLGPDQAELIGPWLTGWLDAAVEQRPELAERTAGYARRRRAELAAGGLRVVVHHQDLLAGHD